MRGRTLDLLAAASPPCATPAAAASSRPVARELAFVPGENAAVGWYRAKIICPGGGLRRVGVAALGTGQRLVGSFETSVPGRFSAYIHVGPQIASVRFRLEIAGARAGDGMTATMRPIGLAEFIWNTLRRGLLRRPIAHLRYFHRPADPFIVSLAFPRPPRFADENEAYDWWIGNREAAACRELIRPAAATTAQSPTLAILLNVSDPRPDHLKKAIDSVLSQSSPNWQIAIADDASVNLDIRAILDDAAKRDSRIAVHRHDRRGGVSAALNAALALVSAPFLTRLDPADTLAPFAIEAAAAHLRDRPSTRLLYSDEDRIDADERRFRPYFKAHFFRGIVLFIQLHRPDVRAPCRYDEAPRRLAHCLRRGGALRPRAAGS